MSSNNVRNPEEIKDPTLCTFKTDPFYHLVAVNGCQQQDACCRRLFRDQNKGVKVYIFKLISHKRDPKWCQIECN